MRTQFGRLGRFVERRPRLVLLVTLLLMAVAAVGVANTKIVTSQEILVSPDSEAYHEYKDYGRTFGGDPLIVMINGSRTELTSPKTLTALENLRGELVSDSRYRSMVSPLTVLGAAQLPPGVSLDQPGVATNVVYAPDGSVRPQFASLFPNGHELVVVHLAGNLTVAQEKSATTRLVSLVEQSELPGTPVVAGNTRVVSDITTSITKDMTLTGLIAIFLMIIVLYVIFPVRRRLLALPVVLAGVLLTFGLTAAVGVSLTLVTMAGLPVLIGLGMDFAIQFHNRYEEESRAGRRPATGLVTSLAHIGPAVGTAVLATILGFLTLLMSAVPAVQDFGTLLAIGVVVLFLLSLIAFNALLYWLDRKKGANGVKTGDGLFADADTFSDVVTDAVVTDAVAADAVAAGAGVAGRGGAGGGGARHERPWQRVNSALARGIPAVLTRLSSTAMRFGPVVIAVAVVLAVGGYTVDHKLPVQTDVQKLVPSDTPGVRAIEQEQAAIGSTTEVPIMVTAPDVTTPAMLSWMSGFQARVLQTHGQQVLSVDSLATTLQLEPGAPEPSQALVSGALATMPADLRLGLVTDDHTAASMSFHIRHMSIQDMNTLIGQIKQEAQPPAGVDLAAGGTVSIAAAAVNSITNHRTTIALIGFAAVLLGLLVVYRNWRRALTPVIPIALVTGWSSGAMWLFGIELNPLTAVMSALIIGIGTEFTVLLLERFWEELSRGASKQEAIRAAVSRVGRSITASALTVAAGFGALLASSFPALREFGIVTVIDVVLALFATLVVVPPLAMLLTRRSRTSAPAKEQVEASMSA